MTFLIKTVVILLLSTTNELTATLQTTTEKNLIMESLTTKNIQQNYTDRAEKISFRLLTNIDVEGRPESEWDGKFPVGPVEEYKKLVENGHEKESQDIIFSKLVDDIPRCPKNHRKTYCIHFEQENFVQSTTRFEDLQLRIPTTLAINNNQFRYHKSKRLGGNILAGSWRRPHFTIELISDSSFGADDDVTDKKMTSYFNKLVDGWAVIRIGDVEKKWVKYKSDKMKAKKIDVKLRIRCHYCYFAEKKLIFHLPSISLNVIPKLISNVIRNCNPVTHGCCLEDLWLDFSDKDWIGYPKRYNIGKCTGKCRKIGLTKDTFQPKPLKEVEHIFLLKVLSEKKKSKKRLCCVPQKLGPMAVLYRNKNNFEMKIMKKVVITECGCA